MTAAVSPVFPHRLPRRVHAGYALGSLATGAFGTVPGLLLLPYLTDTLGVAAGVAGAAGAVAESLGRAGQPGRRADLRPDPVAVGRSPAVPARRRAGAGAAVRRRSSPRPSAPGPPPGSTWRWPSSPRPPRSPSSRCPYVAMPAELTDDYAERTRLMTWRIAILAVAILVSGAIAPMVVTAGGGGIPGHRWMGALRRRPDRPRRGRRVPRHPRRPDRPGHRERAVAARRNSPWPGATGRSGCC